MTRLQGFLRYMMKKEALLILFFALLAVCAAPPPDGRGGGQGNGNGKGNGNGNGKGNGNGHGNGNGNGNGNGHGNGNENENGHGHGHGRGRILSDDDKQQLLAGCRGRGNCKGKSEKAQKLRGAVKESLRGRGRGGPDDQAIETVLQKTLEAKKALFQMNGLTEVEPHDNGLIGGDMVLNLEQLEQLIASVTEDANLTETTLVPPIDDALFTSPASTSRSSVDGAMTPAIPTNSSLSSPLGRRKRADMMALDYFSGNKWPTTTINFYINPQTFTTTQAGVIRSAMKSIASVSCIKFVEGWKYPLIEILKTPSGTDSGTCGWSSVGYQGDYNSININFDSAICRSTLQGVVVHEALHSLGFAHEHTRYDRDRYLKIYWSNVDAQSYDVYNKDDPHDYNPYCIKFDPLSIMQYDAYVAAIDSSKPAMAPYYYSDYYIPRMGQGTSMSSSDAQLLNRMYCQASTCKDKSTNCGWTACTDCTKYASVCPKSCGKC